MKIRLITEREIADDAYWEYIVELKHTCPWVNGTELKENGRMSHTSEDICGLRKTIATTIIEIVED